MPSKWPIAGGPLMARHCVLAEMETLMQGDKKADNISSVNMVRQFTFNLYSMLLHVIVDVNKDLNFFSFLRS